MRTILLTLLATMTLGCSARTMCDSLQPGAPAAGLPADKLRSRDPFRLPGIMGRAESAYSGSFDNGPAEQHLCCFSQSLGEPYWWCGEAQLQCDPAFQDVDVVYLREPYSDQSLAPDSADYCFAAVKAGIIVAVWYRHWS